MRKCFLTVVALVSLTVNAQVEKVSVVKNLYNIQTGFGLWVNNETKLTQEVALRSELGLSGAYQKRSGESVLAFVPGVSVEPRWYFNLKKRYQEGKDVAFNCANYWSVKAFYVSDAFIIATNNAELERNNLNVTVNWGLKRNLNANWHYELGVGLGADVLYKETDGFLTQDSPFVGSFTVRIGYKL
ncbi:hypothetical protein Q4595_01555 [Wenyingzhuangia sp. 1_MG-2023]|nr:hypothetical protein [Wenyingzhuangia sp. 1_MG-2023]